MARNQNERSPSTTYEWRKVKISGGAPEGPSPQASAPRKRWAGLGRRSGKGALTVTIVHRGGAESWWLIKARGRSGVFPGHRCLDDVMAEVNQTWSR